MGDEGITLDKLIKISLNIDYDVGESILKKADSFWRVLANTGS